MVAVDTEADWVAGSTPVGEVLGGSTPEVVVPGGREQVLLDVPLCTNKCPNILYGLVIVK